MKNYQSFSSEETKKFGEKIARNISNGGARKGAKSAFVIALTGNLGSGKTTFVQGFLRGLGIKKRAASPTFVIMRRSSVRRGEFRNVYHVDAYRLKEAKDLAALGFGEILDNPRNLVLIEWAEKIKKILPKGTLRLKFRHCRKETERKISL
jgi:tRNA threonylcarbamoyladenosine biosynthesis protein TsaE